jgi:hypothetical protein
MTTIEYIRKVICVLNDVIEKPHFDKIAFWCNKRIFATIDIKKSVVSVKMDSVSQSVYIQIKPGIALPASGSWGKQGWTIFDLNATPKTILKECIKKAYDLNEQGKKVTSKSKDDISTYIQTLHPDSNKTNKKIHVSKYNMVKKNILEILIRNELTHTELMEALYLRMKDHFEGGIQWYGEVVKLDLEARDIIERTGNRIVKYKLKAPSC